jgi:cell division protein FtsL/uncharacterized protein (DUF2164 family)
MEPKKSKNSRLSSKKAILLVIIIFGILAIISVILYLTTKNNNTNSSIQQADQLVSQAPEPSTVQPLNSPNAGQPVGKELEDQIASATKQAEQLAAEIEALPLPNNTEEKISYSKKLLDLGRLYYLAMKYSDAIETLDKVEYIEVNDFSDARALSIGSKELAIRFYNQAISALKPIPENQDKISEYTAAIVVIEDGQ